MQRRAGGTGWVAEITALEAPCDPLSVQEAERRVSRTVAADRAGEVTTLDRARVVQRCSGVRLAVEQVAVAALAQIALDAERADRCAVRCGESHLRFGSGDR